MEYNSPMNLSKFKYKYLEITKMDLPHIQNKRLIYSLSDRLIELNGELTEKQPKDNKNFKF